MGFDVASVKLLFIIENETPIYGFMWCGFQNNGTGLFRSNIPRILTTFHLIFFNEFF